MCRMWYMMLSVLPNNNIKQVQSDSCKLRSPKLTSHSGFRKAIKKNSHSQSINTHKRPRRWPCPSIIHLLLKSSCNVKSLQPRGDCAGRSFISCCDCNFLIQLTKRTRNVFIEKDTQDIHLLCLFRCRCILLCLPQNCNLMRVVSLGDDITLWNFTMVLSLFSVVC